MKIQLNPHASIVSHEKEKGNVFLSLFIHCTNSEVQGGAMVGCSAVKYRQIEERAAEVAHYIIDNNATVRQAAKAFGISKSTVHVEVII